MNERTILDQINDAIEIALQQRDASAAVSALSLKAAALRDLRRHPVKRSAPEVTKPGDGVSDYLTELGNHIGRVQLCSVVETLRPFSLDRDGPATFGMEAPGSDDGQGFKICSSLMTTDGRPVWTLTKSGIRFHVEVANATYRPDTAEAA